MNRTTVARRLRGRDAAQGHSAPATRVRGYLYGAFYRLPAHWRRRLVRLITTKYVVGAVVLVRAEDDGEPERIVLLRQPPGRAWSLPAGLLKRGEAAPDGAARELFEETGLRVDAHGLIPL